MYTKKSPLVPVTLSKSHICTKINTTISGKPRGVVEPLTVTSPSRKHGIGGARPKTTAKAVKSLSDKKSMKSRKQKLKKAGSNEDDWYYYEDINTSKSTYGSVHVHKPKNQRDKTPVREPLSFKVIWLVLFILLDGYRYSGALFADTLKLWEKSERSAVLALKFVQQINCLIFCTVLFVGVVGGGTPCPGRGNTLPPPPPDKTGAPPPPPLPPPPPQQTATRSVRLFWSHRRTFLCSVCFVVFVSG